MARIIIQCDDNVNTRFETHIWLLRKVVPLVLGKVVAMIATVIVYCCSDEATAKASEPRVRPLTQLGLCSRFGANGDRDSNEMINN